MTGDLVDAVMKENADEYPWRRCAECSPVRQQDPPFVAWCPECHELHGGDGRDD